MKKEILIQMLENMILRQKDHVKETEGAHLRAKGMLKDLQEIRDDIVNGPGVVQQGNIVLGDMVGGDIKK